ncbi:glycosyltransferase family 4 protein [Amylibacter sp.]|nr:glycosyltransferase family 4 protein [Amylibacter sp.]
MKIFITANSGWNLINFRMGLMRELIKNGNEVVAVVPPSSYLEALKKIGVRVILLPMDSHGLNPISDGLLSLRFYRILRRERPLVLLTFTIKPSIYGTLAASMLNIPVINNVTGLGAAFLRGGFLTFIVRGLYRLAFSHSQTVFFQNQDDFEKFVTGGLVKAEVAQVLPGSGVNLNEFSMKPLIKKERVIKFLMISRILKDKGVIEYAAAAKAIWLQNKDIEFSLLGLHDIQNPNSVSQTQLNGWIENGGLNYLGTVSDVRPYIADADCIVLPSYREGTSRTLIEAAATGRLIVTTDVAGCRDVVEDGVNGYLCCVKDIDDLIEKLLLVSTISHQKRVEMGVCGRQKAVREFDEQIIVDRYLNEISYLS